MPRPAARRSRRWPKAGGSWTRHRSDSMPLAAATAHRDGGHGDRPRSFVTRVYKCFKPGHATSARHDRVLNQQNGVLRHHAHQHEQPDDRGYREAGAGEDERQQGAPERQRQRHQDRHGLQEIVE